MSNLKTNGHTFHIPVMGIGFTIDTPLKVAQYGMDSAISLGDDILLEKLRKFYSEKNNLSYIEISNKMFDHRAKRITSYLNMINELATKNIEDLKNTALEKIADLRKYFEMLPNGAYLKSEFKKLTSSNLDQKHLSAWLKDNLSMGSIDVNVMTKVDKENYWENEKLPQEYNDAHAAVRGFANSALHSSIILSAGMSPRLYGYLQNFEDFFPNKNGEIKKKIVLKVSDYRSALIQGKFLAKKGLWVSEYRIESGLNCGGHAFATEGHLLGPILAEFRDNKSELVESVNEILLSSLKGLNKEIPNSSPSLKITAQGGVGTAEEHQFLIDHYKIDSVGWGSPFLLVPEATTVDQPTIDKLIQAKEKDLYLSNISPLGVPFNNLRGNTKDLEKQTLMDNNRPGSKCPKRFLALNKEFNEKGVCTASRDYQRTKIKALSTKELDKEEYEAEYGKIVDKSCICVGLGTSALLVNDIDTKVEGEGVSICPGPNMAYFSRSMSLKEITSHIYGRMNVISRKDRPTMFIKELNIYVDYLKNKIEEAKDSMNKKQENYLTSFNSNLQKGIGYYQDLFRDLKDSFTEEKERIFEELNSRMEVLNHLAVEIDKNSKNFQISNAKA